MAQKQPELDEQGARERIEAAVRRAGKALQDLSGEFERGAAHLSSTDVARTFDFLGQTLAASRAKAELSIVTGRAANGGFSLDGEPVEHALPVEALAPAASPASQNPGLSGRLVGAGKKSGAAKPQTDDDDEIVFLDE